MGPVAVTGEHGLDVGPHPHIGLQTATWLIEGEALHRDSLGSEQLLTPGQLNLMTAGHGIAHSEEATPHYAGRLQGIQLWIALPEATRAGPPAFAHHATLPKLEFSGADALLFMGAVGGQASPARHDTPLVGLDLSVHGAAEIPLRPDFEHALIVLEGAIRIDGVVLEPGHLGYLGPGRDQLGIDHLGASRAILLGGEPFPETIAMWWNFVGRTRQEFVEAYRSWAEDGGRFGTVSSPLPRIMTTPPLPDRTTDHPPASL
jgi:redox-sensitive bicupin YhaK (pirin superfamily)